MIKILKIGDVTELTRLSRTTVYNQVKAGNFPKPIKISARASGWLSHEIQAWIEKQAHAREVA